MNSSLCKTLFAVLVLLTFQNVNAQTITDNSNQKFKWCKITQNQVGPACHYSDSLYEAPDVDCSVSSAGKMIAGYRSASSGDVLTCVGPNSDLSKLGDLADLANINKLEIGILRPKNKYGLFSLSSDGTYKFNSAQNNSCNQSTIGQSIQGAYCYRYEDVGAKQNILAKTPQENLKILERDNKNFSVDRASLITQIEKNRAKADAKAEIERIKAVMLAQEKKAKDLAEAKAAQEKAAKEKAAIPVPKAPVVPATAGGGAVFGPSNFCAGPSDCNAKPAPVTYHWRKVAFIGIANVVVDVPIWGYEVPNEACSESNQGQAYLGVYDDKSATKEINANTADPKRNSEIIYCLASNAANKTDLLDKQKNLDLTKLKKLPLREERIYKWAFLTASGRAKESLKNDPLVQKGLGLCSKDQIGEEKTYVPSEDKNTVRPFASKEDLEDYATLVFKCSRVKLNDVANKDGTFKVIADSKESLEKYEKAEEVEIERRISSLLDGI